MELREANFATGSLHRVSYARPGKLFTASRDLLVAQVAALDASPLRQIIETVIGLLRGGLTR